MASDKDHYHYDPFYYNHHELNQPSFPLFRDNNHSMTSQNFHQGLDPSHHTSFTDCLHGSMDYNTLSRAFDLSCSSPEVISSIDDNNPKKLPSAGDSSVGISGNQSTTLNSSVSSSSNEADAVTEEDSAKSKKHEKQPKGCEAGDEKSKKE